MARAIWKGAISFGLVHIPVSLSAATSSQGIDFDWLDQRSMEPVGYKRVNKVTGKEIERENIVKGVEYEKGRYVVLSEEEIRAAHPKSTQTIEIFAFVDSQEIPCSTSIPRTTWPRPARRQGLRAAPGDPGAHRQGRPGQRRPAHPPAPGAPTASRGRPGADHSALAVAGAQPGWPGAGRKRHRGETRQARAGDGQAPGGGHGLPLGAGRIQDSFSDKIMKLVEEKAARANCTRWRKRRRWPARAPTSSISPTCSSAACVPAPAARVAKRPGPTRRVAPSPVPRVRGARPEANRWVNQPEPIGRRRARNQ